MIVTLLGWLAIAAVSEAFRSVPRPRSRGRVPTGR
jgi:hypothetical protein